MRPYALQPYYNIPLHAQYLLEEWSTIPPAEFPRLVENMQRHIEAVLAACVGLTLSVFPLICHLSIVYCILPGFSLSALDF